MVTPLLPGYEHDVEPGAGLQVLAGATKAVVHTTESPRGSWGAVRNLWRGPANWGRGLPHFLADRGRVVQLLPLTVNAYTLANPPGPPDTNRSGLVVQVEWCRYAKDPWADDELDALGRWLADLVHAGADLDVGVHPRFYGAGDGIVLATPTSPARMSPAAYDRFNGWCGHQHVPQNDHWDPGALDADRVAQIARDHLAPSSEVLDVPAQRAVRFATPTGDTFVFAGDRWVHVNAEQLADLQARGIVSTDPAIELPGSGDDNRRWEMWPVYNADGSLQRQAVAG